MSLDTCACGLQTSQPNEADNLISWDEPQIYNGDLVKSQVFGRPHASLANSNWARSMLGPAQVAEQQDIVEAEAGALLCTAALPTCSHSATAIDGHASCLYSKMRVSASP